MLSNRFAFAALAVACITAAAGGGYLASRQNAVPAPVTAAAPIPTTSASATPVQETEAIVSETTTRRERPQVPAPVASAPIIGKRIAAVAPKTAPANRVETAPASTAAKASDPLPTLDRTWPSSAANTPPTTPATVSSAVASPAPATDITQQPAKVEERAAKPEAPRAPEPPLKTFEELVVSADSVIGLQNETSLTSERARVEDRVEARVTRDVRVGDAVAIPAGVRVIGSVTQVERGGKFKERARLGIRFHTLVLADGTRLSISTETIYREGEAPNGAAKVGGGAVGGAILGAILGGAKGAVIGATTGAGAGTAVAATGDRSAATFPAGTQMTVRLLSPVTVTIEQK